MKILIACEWSGAVRDAFIEKGHDAFSCDVLPSEGKYSSRHLQQDVIPLLKEKWDMIVAFPPCTYLTVTGNRWFNVSQYGNKAMERLKYREEAIKFFMSFSEANSKRIAIENPVGVMSSRWRKPDQIIQPYQFGDPYEKRTCLWLIGLPPLIPTKTVKPEPRRKFDSGKSMAPWYADLFALPKEERAKIRGKTFLGIAKAMADQWGSF